MGEDCGERVEGAGATLGEDWRVIESLLPAGWMDMARELGAFRRARGFADARALLRVMLIHLADGCGLRETAARAALAGLADVSDVALLKRLKSCEGWFEWMAQRLREPLPPRERGAQAGAPALLADRRLRVVDGSIVREPGPTGSQWRLHYAIGLPGLDCQEVHLGPSDDGETLRRFSVRPGDVFIADRGYAHAAGIAHVRQHEADVIVRLNLVTLPLYGPRSAQRWDILAHVRGLKAGEARGWQVSVRPKGAPPIAGRLCAVRKSAAAAARARERVRRESLRGGHELRPETLEAADYVFVFTTLGDDISAEQVLALYRLRWQIELEFKRLKSLIQLGHLKKHDDQAARSWLQGKLLVALLIARLIDHAERVSPWGYDIAALARTPQPLPVA
jgi:transposase